MRNLIPILTLAVALMTAGLPAGAMGGGGDPTPRTRVNPPSAADVDAAQSGVARTDTDAGAAQSELELLAADSVTPDQFLWQARPVVVFADTAADPAFRVQIESLRGRPQALMERDVVVIVDTDPAAASIWRQRLNPRGFSLIIMDKDGQVKQRKPSPWTVREIIAAIDKFPLRLEEIGRAGILQ
ncbi:MAG: DUF4174 domain-containing protein [Paracoccus sp. (in: a-proteobacteria)]|nr:DUF4174 domain-containing protein [Paracoccus sp. (in: a-proteobacteria)]